MRRQRLAAAAFGFALAAALPLTADAQGASSLNGTFRLNAAASENVHDAIDAAVRPMNRITRPIARRRLRGTNVAYARVVIATSGGQHSIQFDERAAVVSPADGTAIRWRREDGEDFDVTQRVTNGRLEQRFVAEDGSRTNVFTLSPDGNTLTMQVIIESPRLRDPLVYRLVYSRS
jgi:hypothetical protein